VSVLYIFRLQHFRNEQRGIPSNPYYPASP
jgi:hypothetical protein